MNPSILSSPKAYYSENNWPYYLALPPPKYPPKKVKAAKINPEITLAKSPCESVFASGKKASLSTQEFP
jgi:hypothetical protein